MNLSRVDIVHASVLNPVRHPRLLYRQATTQAKAGYRVAVVAVADSEKPLDVVNNVLLIGLPALHRLSLSRLWRPWVVMREAFRLQPRLVHLHSPELLVPALVLKPRSVKLVYDVHEDYAANIRGTGAWPRWVRSSLAKLVRRLEQWASRRMDAVVYAEACYGKLLPVNTDRTWQLLNRFTPPAPWVEPVPPVDAPVMVYSGNLSAAWGIEDAIRLWDRLNHHQPVHLVVAASGDESVWQQAELHAARQRWPGRWTRLGEAGFVPHSLVIAWMKRATFGLALYQPLPHLLEKQPSKMFEWMALGIPAIYRSTPAWDAWNARVGFGVGISVVDDDAVDLVLSAMRSGFPAVSRQIPEVEWSWEANDAPVLLQMTATLLRSTKA